MTWGHFFPVDIYPEDERNKCLREGLPKLAGGSEIITNDVRTEPRKGGGSQAKRIRLSERSGRGTSFLLKERSTLRVGTKAAGPGDTERKDREG